MTCTSSPHITRRELAALIFGTAIVGNTSHVAAAISPAELYVRKIADEVMSLANSGVKGTVLRNRFSSLLSRYVNLRAIANFALGPYQKKLPPRDRNKFYALFSNYAAALFVYYVDDFKGSDLQIISTSKQGRFITIVSAIKQKGGGREQVRWRLVPAGGGYKISDINVKGVWLTIVTKKRFNDVLNRSKGDFEPLFAELREAKTW